MAEVLAIVAVLIELSSRCHGLTRRGVAGRPPLPTHVAKSSELSLSQPGCVSGSVSEGTCCCCCALRTLLLLLRLRTFSDKTSETFGAGELLLNPENDPAECLTCVKS